MKLRLAIAAVVAVALVVGVAIAGGIADRETVTISSGSAVWTNTASYRHIDLERISVWNTEIATDTVTVSRVTSDNTYTQTVGTVSVSGGSGTQTTLAYQYLLPGDMLSFTATSGSNATAMVEFLAQQ